MKIAIVGAGFAGSVLARELSSRGKHHVIVFDERPHVAGNCHTEVDESTGVTVHTYGPHIFNTNREDVSDYVNQFGWFYPYTNRVKAVTSSGVFSLPINLLTINQVFGTSLRPDEAKKFISSISEPIKDPSNFEEQALSLVGTKLYELFLYGYTKKQWGVDPKLLPASILKRLPVRFNYEDNYYSTQFQGIPISGYTAIVENILEGIDVRLSEKFLPEYRKNFDHVFYSGSIDGFYNYKFGRLGYRTLDFIRGEYGGDFQGGAVVNDCREGVPYTRISEHKHFSPWVSHSSSVYFTEYSRLAEGDDTPYYPLRLNIDSSILSLYVNEAMRDKNITFIGRLGTYRYLNMDAVIGESLDLSSRCLSSNKWPTFSVPPI